MNFHRLNYPKLNYGLQVSFIKNWDNIAIIDKKGRHFWSHVTFVTTQ